jgi:hypothetical protein
MRHFLAAAFLVVAHCGPRAAPVVVAPSTPAPPVVMALPRRAPPAVAAPPAPVPSVTLAPSTPAASAAEEASGAPAIDDVAEVVLRHLFRNNASGAQQTVGVYCLEVRKSDPDDAFLARFHDITKPVRKASDCEVSSQGVFEKATHRSGLLFRVESVAWTDADGAKARGGYYAGSESASGNTYWLQRRAGAWRVVKDVMDWIS